MELITWDVAWCEESLLYQHTLVQTPGPHYTHRPCFSVP